MGDPIYNCAALICCPPESARAEAATAQILIDAGCEKKAAEEAAPYIQKCFDLAKKGTLQPLKDWVADEARGQAYEP
jgi:hypothetical protein